jgi:hypothetical protein
MAVALSLPSIAMADSSDWEDDDDSSEDGGEEGEDESGDEGADTDDGAKDGRCTAAAVNPTTALSVGLGMALLFGLRRKD